MKTQFFKMVLLISIMFVSFGGTASARTDMTENVTIKRISTNDNIHIQSVKIIQDGENLIVTGKLDFNRNQHGFNRHIDISILSPEGKKINEASVHYTPRFRSRNSLRKAHRKSHFKASFSETLQEGATVCVALHHSPDNEKSGTFNCGNIISSPE